LLNGYNLGNWVGLQKIAYKEGKLSTGKIKKLEALGILWDTFDTRWNKGFEYYKQYVKENKSCHIKNSNNFNGYSLGRWVSKQVRKYNEGKLSTEKIKKLEALGVNWAGKFDEQWNEAFGFFKQYVEENKSAAVSRKYKFNHFYLGEWVSGQRKKYKSKQLSPERIKKLEDLGFFWDASDSN
jgi:hypothetical protein